MKKESRRDLQQQITLLQEQLALLAWLHAERDHHLLNAFNTVTQAITLTAWVFAERDHFMQQFMEAEERLRRRALAVKAARTQAEQNAQALQGVAPR